MSTGTVCRNRDTPGSAREGQRWGKLSRHAWLHLGTVGRHSWLCLERGNSEQTSQLCL